MTTLPNIPPQAEQALLQPGFIENEVLSGVWRMMPVPERVCPFDRSGNHQEVRDDTLCAKRQGVLYSRALTFD